MAMPTATNSWPEYYHRMVDLVASKSKDPSTKVGCVIIGPDMEVRTTGFNGLPRGCKDPESATDLRNGRPLKYYYYEHAERNAIYNAARVGIPLSGCTAYMHSPPCADCARGLIQAGVVRVVLRSIASNTRWYASCLVGIEMMAEAGVVIDWPLHLQPGHPTTDIGSWLLGGYRKGWKMTIQDDNPQQTATIIREKVECRIISYQDVGYTFYFDTVQITKEEEGSYILLFPYSLMTFTDCTIILKGEWGEDRFTRMNITNKVARSNNAR